MAEVVENKIRDQAYSSLFKLCDSFPKTFECFIKEVSKFLLDKNNEEFKETMNKLSYFKGLL